MRFPRALIVLLVVPLAGCVEDTGDFTGGSDASIQAAYKDADVQARNSVAGEDSVTKTINVPVGTSKFTVKAWYSVAGEGDFVLTNPAGLTAREAHPEGSANVRDDDWYVDNDPAPGPWKLSIDIQGSGSYAFGAYY